MRISTGVPRVMRANIFLDYERTWSRVLDGEWAEQAQEYIQILLRHIGETDFFLPGLDHSDSRLAKRVAASLDNGLAGIALALTYHFLSFGHLRDRRRAVSCLDRAFSLTEDTYSIPTLFEGFLGPAWVAAHLSYVIGEEKYLPALASLDEVLLDTICRNRWERKTWGGHFDVINGLAGIGIYALERLPHQSGRRIARWVIEQLGANSSHLPEGACWVRASLSTPTLPRHDHQVEFGMAHGQEGVIAFLSRAVVSGIERDKARELLAAAVDYNRHITKDWSIRFRAGIPNGQPQPADMFSWCYGDIGASFSLLAAGGALGRLDLCQSAHDLAERAARAVLSHGDLPILNSVGLCHGWAGLAHQLQRWALLTNEEIFFDAAKRCYVSLLRLLSGYEVALCCRSWGGAVAEMTKDMILPGLLLGGAGISLSLLGASSKVLPAWGRALLITPPDEKASLWSGTAAGETT